MTSYHSVTYAFKIAKEWNREQGTQLLKRKRDWQ